MKIAFLHNNLNDVGGIEKVTIFKANELAKRGHSVYILVRLEYNPQNFTTAQLHPSIEVITYGQQISDSLFSLSWLKAKRQQAETISRFITTYQPDILIHTGLTDLLFIRFLQLGNTKVIMETHHSLQQKESAWHHFKSTIAGCVANFIKYKLLSAKVNCYAILTHEDINYFPGNKKKAVVIPNPITITPIKSNLSDKVIITTGRLAAEKQLPIAIHAMRQVVDAHPDWQLHIYGGGPEKVVLQSLISELQLENNVILKGVTTQIADVLSQASIYVSASPSEGFSLSICEAAACGLPLVCVTNTGVREFFDKEDVGFLLGKDNIEQMADRLCRLIEDENLRHKLGANAARRSQEFNLQHIIDLNERLFIRLIGR